LDCRYEKVDDTITNQSRLLPDNPDRSFSKYLEREYLNGKQNGKWTHWYPNGKFKKKEYLNGKENVQIDFLV